ncbi:hypothetical protein ACFFX1_07650 [Dactylosporangium sucinum]|uniref:Uncharacterized protein n=1 Tax=Dactylosporangium sucinum TaxID=1424081 RepID=A0A917U3U5_9ACTN|nr:hypothetical protein [Dactylosporangium sucinum]GGM56328.1 hypothetical protein GCM10007977_067550 [Dactylosporangium sucinum]
MSYAFQPEDPVQHGYGITSWQMRELRLVLLEAGAIAGDGLERIFGNARFAPGPETVPVAMFSSNDGWRISPQRCAFIASRLRAALDAGLIGDMALFYEDQSPDLPAWVTEFAAFNERAAAWGGYRVR